MNAKAEKTEEHGSLTKSEKVKLNRLYSRSKAAFGSCVRI